MTLQNHPNQAAIRALHDTHGALTPTLLVRTARDPVSELHELFDWENFDDAQLLARARNLIRSMRIEVTNRSGRHVVPEYLAVYQKERGLEYRATLLTHARVTS